MGINRIYERNKIQLMAGKRQTFKYFVEPNKALKQLANREQPYREMAERERKINEEKKQQRLDRKSELAIMNLKLLAEAIK